MIRKLTPDRDSVQNLNVSNYFRQVTRYYGKLYCENNINGKVATGWRGEHGRTAHSVAVPQPPRTPTLRDGVVNFKHLPALYKAHSGCLLTAFTVHLSSPLNPLSPTAPFDGRFRSLLPRSIVAGLLVLGFQVNGSASVEP